MVRYVHTNLVARDVARLIAFYTSVLGCAHIGETRDLSGDWLDRLTGVPGAHIRGEHLLLPGYGPDHPTLEIFAYDAVPDAGPHRIDAPGLAHLAFEVDDVSATLAEVLAAGGGQVGEVVRTEYTDGRVAEFVYATDPEGTIIELQHWA